ncbi:Ubiquitin-conjugating enzyme E2 Q2 [Platysternon megacephalum]|uniref:Ubiquitin-conjugating enzyme E2 Q2 n=1 Tax=Platysternon megacephalum TaxID=55544 RepID=A0A4D9F2C9_9SAUR|nr:Ubiquitin-conjugating enzyme E2 Q2 [Platysternon megacephalum]
MSVSGFKAELKLLESIFNKDHECFCIISWKLDERHCQFVLLPPPPESSPQPPLLITIHCNVMESYPSSSPIRLYNLPQHPDVEMLNQPLPTGRNAMTEEVMSEEEEEEEDMSEDIEDLDHYDMKKEEPVDGKKSEHEGIEKEKLPILEKIRKN